MAPRPHRRLPEVRSARAEAEAEVRRVLRSYPAVVLWMGAYGGALGLLHRYWLS